jgi:beta-lactamase regulating signal transducer with metallopeptidase domain
MYETETLLAASVIVSTLTSLAALGLVRLARLGSPMTRSFVLLVALAMAFSVFWVPFALTPSSDDTGVSVGPGLGSISGAQPVPFIDRSANVSVFNGTSNPLYAVREPVNSPPARLIDGRGPPRTCATRAAVVNTSVPESSGMDAARLNAASGIAAAQFGSSTQATTQASQGVHWFWALSAGLLFAAAAYLAVQLASGKKRLLARLGARPCLDSAILELVGRTARKMGVRPPRIFICDGPANAFVFGYPATLVISSRLLGRLTKTKLELCIRHELAHVRNGDLLVKPLLQSMRILFVYNPGVHLLIKRMLKERELAADRLFIKSRNDRIDFLSALTTLHKHETKQAPSADIPMGASALGAHRAGSHLEERFDNLFKEQEPRPLRAVSLCALIVFANLSFLGVPAAILQTSGATDAQDDTGMFPPMHGHFMSMRAMAEPGRSMPRNITANDAGYPVPDGDAAAGPWPLPPGGAAEFEPFPMDSAVRW